MTTLTPSPPPLLPARSSPPVSVPERDQGRGAEDALGGERANTRANNGRDVNNGNVNKQGDHENEGGTASAVRRSTRGLARRGAAAAVATVMGNTAREEGDREM